MIVHQLKKSVPQVKRIGTLKGRDGFQANSGVSHCFVLQYNYWYVLPYFYILDPLSILTIHQSV